MSFIGICFFLEKGYDPMVSLNITRKQKGLPLSYHVCALDPKASFLLIPRHRAHFKQWYTGLCLISKSQAEGSRSKDSCRCQIKALGFTLYNTCTLQTRMD